MVEEITLGGLRGKGHGERFLCGQQLRQHGLEPLRTVQITIVYNCFSAGLATGNGS